MGEISEKNREKYLKAILDHLESEEGKDTIWVKDLCSVVGISKECFYSHFPVGSDFYDNIKEKLEKNRVQMHNFITKVLKNQAQDGSASAAIYLHKMTQCQEAKEHMNNTEDKVSDTNIPPINVTIVNKSMNKSKGKK
jgi:hypothetical protein